jgi:hypothetical protein
MSGSLTRLIISDPVSPVNRFPHQIQRFFTGKPKMGGRCLSSSRRCFFLLHEDAPHGFHCSGVQGTRSGIWHTRVS